MREYKTLRALRSGEVVDLAGLRFKMIPGKLEPGDLYIAERNTGPQLLTVKKVADYDYIVFPTCNGYAFDLSECVKVEEVL